MTEQATTFGEAHSMWPTAAEKPRQASGSQYDYELARRVASGDMKALQEGNHLSGTR